MLLVHDSSYLNFPENFEVFFLPDIPCIMYSTVLQYAFYIYPSSFSKKPLTLLNIISLLDFVFAYMLYMLKVNNIKSKSMPFLHSSFSNRKSAHFRKSLRFRKRRAYYTYILVEALYEQHIELSNVML